MNRVAWVDEVPKPVARTKRSRELDAMVEELKTNCGQWAKVATNQARTSATDRWTRRGCEATVRRNAAGTYDVYARYPEPDLAEVDPYIARRRARGIPTEGKRHV